MSDFLSRVHRRALLIGGPSDGGGTPMLVPESHPWPRFICTGQTADWHHYAHAVDGTYRYVGPCAEIDHDGCEPHDHDDCGGAS